MKVKNILKRFGSLALVLVMLAAMIPGFTLAAKAAGTLNTISGLTATWTDASNSKGSASWSASGTSITGTATGYKQYGVIGNTITTTLTLTNSFGSEAALSFDYTLEGGGSVSGISGESYSGVLADGDSLTITLTSPSGTSTNTLSITGLSLISTSAGDVTTTFKTAEGGSYTVAEGSGTAEEITAETQKTAAAGTEYTVSATAASGYLFFGWYNETTGKIMSNDTPYTFKASADMTLVPRFISDTTALFGVGTAKFDDLTEAGAYAAAGGVKTIVLLNDGTVSGSHTIPAGTTLLIPFDDNNTLYTDTPETTSSFLNNVAWVKPTAYRTLTLAADADITVNGAISLSAKHAAGGSGGNAGSPTGPCSFMNMTEGSRITLNSGAALYAWGYVTGSGTITAKSGSKVYENFQIRDFRGGTATSAMANDGLVFPLSQYYVQNVEAPITYESGAEEWVYTSLYMSSMVFSASVKFVGDGAMFQPKEGGSVTKTYIGSSDRLNIDVRGNATLSSIQLSISGTNINSASYILPINSNIDINILSGTTTVSQDLALLPGSAVSISDGATLDIAYTDSPSPAIESGVGYNLFAYDADEWTYGYDGDLNRVDGVKYVYSGYRFIPLSYAPGRTYTRTEADLKDVVIDVNGTITADGFLFTTAGGASIISSGKTGRIVMASGAGTEEYIFQATQSGSDITYYAIPVTSAVLKNGDGTYTETAGAVANDTFIYNAAKDKWVKEGEIEEITVTFNANGGEGSMEAQTIESGVDAVLADNSFTREHYSFKEWNTAQDGNGTSYKNGATVNFTEDTTLYATWEIDTFTVTWKNEDGTVLKTDENVA
ncbi:MAG: InlB B-repeat-containing protein, partial [Candidatus Avispirillum sp.]